MPNKEEYDLTSVANIISKRLLDCKKRNEALNDIGLRNLGLEGYIDGLQFSLDCILNTLIGKEQ